jgi:hypothetical protein
MTTTTTTTTSMTQEGWHFDADVIVEALRECSTDVDDDHLTLDSNVYVSILLFF